MSSEWPLVPVGEIAQLFDGPHATPAKTSSGPVFLGISSLRRGQLDLSNTEHLSETDFTKWTRRVTPQADDVVFSYETRIGEVAIIPDGLKCCLGRRMALLRPDRAKLLPKYLLYYFLSDEFQSLLLARTIHGSTVDRLPLKDFPTYPMRVPPLDVQRTISSMLQVLDDRIALLRETNATLEAIAQALFKSWFVDFDPVHARARGEQPAGLAPEVAALFPDSFEESELGMVPKGWGVQLIRDVVEGVYDGPHATPPESDVGPVFLGIKNLTGTALALSDVRHIADEDFIKWTKRVTPKAGDIVFSYEATLGFFALIPDEVKCCLGRRLALIRPMEIDGHGHFWFHQFVAAPFQRHLEKHTIQGATVNRIALKEFPGYPVLNPSSELKQAFEVRAAAIWHKIHLNQKQAQTLANLRDTLLPRLISGQLRLNCDVVYAHSTEGLSAND
ncbi:restriction endonuclease subunit S [Aeromonas jandaei]|uniref:restriction endonuclease subunit S n=1 Tax=Aeromonas jandaei TaxID=650 RepID=UPI001BB52C5E|nr:restriction endonuclease subunit S [Aeromonas jandaei]QTL94232.1 EcoKI restriction-modification system protein HsdS [Aeromonas jandaei]